MLTELQFTSSRSGGPGGQNVNKRSTAMLLRWNLPDSVAVEGALKAVLMGKLKNKLTREFEIVIKSDEFRSQDANKQFCVEKFLQFIVEATRARKKRIKSKPTKSSIEKRHKNKKIRGNIKKMRGRVTKHD